MGKLNICHDCWCLLFSPQLNGLYTLGPLVLRSEEFYRDSWTSVYVFTIFMKFFLFSVKAFNDCDSGMSLYWGVLPPQVADRTIISVSVVSCYEQLCHLKFY